MSLTLAKPTIGLPGWGGTMNGNIDNIKAYADSVDAQMVNFARKLSVSVNYYVNANTGNDNNDGLSSDRAFKTLTHAITKIPEINTTEFGGFGGISINVANGNYTSEASSYIFIVGKGMFGILNIVGNATNPSLCKLPSIYVRGVANVTIDGFEFVPGGTAGVYVTCCSFVNTYNSLIDGISKTKIGVYYGHGSCGTVQDCVINNCSHAISVRTSSQVTSFNVTGSNNNYGLHAEQTAIIGKLSTQPSGTTAAEVTYNKGEIW